MGQSRSWLLDDRLTDIRYHSGTAPKIALNAPRSEEVKAWVIKRDELLQGWSENDLLDLEEIWSRAATGENKIAMVPPRSPLLPSMRIRLLIVTLARSQALEAHGELTWGAVEFDNKMETLSVARRQKLNRANNKKKRKKVRPCATLTTGTGTEPTHEPCVLGWGLGRR